MLRNITKRITDSMVENNYKTKKVDSPRRDIMPKSRIVKKLCLVIGILMQLFALFLFVAMVSNFFCAKSDQSVVESIAETGIKVAANSTRNWLGLVGAILSYYFVYKWLGLSAFFLIFPMYLIGHRIVYGKTLLGIGLLRNVTFSSISILYFSLLLGYLYILLPVTLSESLALFIGGVGLELALLFKGLFGWGAFPMMIMLFFVTAIYFFDIDVIVILRLFSRLKNIFWFGRNNRSYGVDAFELNKCGEGKIEVKYKPMEDLMNPSHELELQVVPHGDNGVEVDNSLKQGLGVSQQIEDYASSLRDYKFPNPELLNIYSQEASSVSKVELEQNKKKIVDTLINFTIGVSSIHATIGPTVTLYEIIPEAGVKISRIKNLEDDIALSLSALGIRIIAPIPGKGTIGIEVPNKNKQIVPLRAIIESESFKRSTMDLPIVIGKGIDNETCIVDLATMPHLLIAGATGQGKSVGINVVLSSLIYKKHPSQLKLVLVDPKKVELSLYSKLEHHFLAKLPGTADAIITETKKVIHTLKSLCNEMDQRYELLKNAGVRNIKEYNIKFNKGILSKDMPHRSLPYIVLVIDEFADLMMVAGKEVEMPIARLAQLARAIGIHLVLATQRPSVNIITGIIKANFPVRISFKVSSKVDSRTILDSSGADQLVGRGDLLLSINSNIIRLQCPFLDTEEVERVCSFIHEQPGYLEPYLLPEANVEEEDSYDEFSPDESLANKDPLFAEAAQLIVMSQQGSTSLIQRRMKLGYNRAGRLMDQLEDAGIVGPSEGSKPRGVIVGDMESLQIILNKLDS